MDRQHLTNIPISNVRLPVWSLIPNTIDRFVFDEVIADNELFMNMHNNKTIQEIQLNPIRQSLDNIACDIVAGAHHGSCKLVYSTGSVGSGHGPLVFGVSNNEVPEVGLLWSILDALQVDQDWPQIACFTTEGLNVRDLLSNEPNGRVFRPRTKNGLITAETLEDDGLTTVPLGYRAKQLLTQALHQKRRCLATWHALDQVIDRSDRTKNIKLQNIYNQVGSNNYQIALDVCGCTSVLIFLGPERDYSQILITDIPCYAHNSTIADYKASLQLADVQRQSAGIKNAIKMQNKDNIMGKLILGCVPTLFVKDNNNRDMYLFNSIQVSDFDRAQTHSVLKLAAQFDVFVGDRYFQAVAAERRRREKAGQLSSQYGQHVAETQQQSNAFQLTGVEQNNEHDSQAENITSNEIQRKFGHSIQLNQLLGDTELYDSGANAINMVNSKSAKSQQDGTSDSRAQYTFQNKAKEIERDQQIRSLLTKMKNFIGNIH